MSFLAPLFLIGGLAIALPVVLHLVRRSSREKQLFSSLMFLKPTPPRMTRRNRLEHILLLLLRCLVIGLLAFAFARPFLQKPILAAATDAAGAQIVLLVDTSASMRREGFWAEAMAKAEAALKKTTPTDQVAIFTFDDQVRTTLSFEEWAGMNLADRSALAAQRLAGFQPTWRATHLGNALMAAVDVLEDAGKRDPHTGPRRIVLITDLQEGSRLDGLQGFEWPRGIQVVAELVKIRRPTNAGLQWVLDADDSNPLAAEASVRLRVSNSSDAEREQFQVRWTGSGAAASLDAYVPPGQSRIVPAPPPPANTTSGRLMLSGDDHDFDNSVYVVQPKAEVVDVLYLGNDAETDSSQSLYYLKRAFQDTRRQAVRLVPAESSRRTPAPTTENPPPHLGGYKFAIVTSTLSEEATRNLCQFLTNGGTALLAMNEPQSAKTIGQLTGVPDLAATEASVPNYAMFGQMDFAHPLLAPFADPRFGDFTKIRFWKHRKLSSEKLSGSRIIASYDDNDPAILEAPVGRGRLFVLTSSWRPADSQLALSSKFVPLLYSLLDQAGGFGGQLAQVRVGDSVELSALASRQTRSAMSVRKPDGSVVEIPVGDTRFAQTDQPGIYEVSASAQPPLQFAVNLDAAESRTTPLPVEELERLGVPLKTAEVSPARQLAQQQALHNADLEARQKLWRWLIVAALAVLLVETWLAGRFTRRPAINSEAAV